MESVSEIMEYLIQQAGYNAEAVAQLREYFAGKRTEFTLHPEPAGTPFQQRVWREMQKIPYGETVTYGELARRIGQPKAARAVGMACHRNPIPVIIPCHRVVAAHGKLGGYSLGRNIKTFLLNGERKNLTESRVQSTGR